MSRDDGEIEERLRRHYHAAFGMPPDPAQIQDQVAQVRQAASPSGRSRVLARPLLPTLAAVLVVALLAGLLLFARPGGPLRLSVGVSGTATATAVPTPPLPAVVPPVCGSSSPNPTPTGTPVDHSVAIGRQVTVNDITLTIDRAYADATQTTIIFHAQTTNGDLADPLGGTILSDTQGNRYFAIGGEGGGTGSAGAGDVIFAPLPPGELGTPQMLTFFAPQMLIQMSTPVQDPDVNGPWQISFRLTPAAGASVALSTAPLTRNGLTVQPLRVDVAPAGGGFEGVAGGARIIVRISGLEPSTLLFSLLNFDTSTFRLHWGSGYGPGCGKGTLELVLPNGQQIQPGFVVPLGWAVASPTGSATPAVQRQPTVGPSGTAELEALFFQPIPAVSSVILYVDQMPVLTNSDAQPKYISGPWEFQLVPGA